MKKALRVGISILVSLGLMWILFYRTGFQFQKIPEALSRVPIYILILCFMIYLLKCVLRSIRFNITLNGRVGVSNLFKIVAIHQLFNGLLPARTGEFSYIYLLGKKEDIPAGQSSASLMIARVFDFIVFILFIIFSLGLMRNSLPFTSQQVGIAIIVLSVILIGIILLFLKADVCLRFLEHLLYKSRLRKGRFVNYITRKLIEAKVGFCETKLPKKLLSIFMLSFGVLILTYYGTYLFLSSIGIRIGFLQFAIAMSLTILTLLLPIQGIGNLGTYEGTFVLGLAIFGISENIALPVVFSLHLISYIFFIVTGIWGWITMKGV